MKQMITVSLCMIVKNEEETLARCLRSVQGVADEIVIVDTGSTDRTKEIAADFTDKIFDFEWIDDFSAARNFSFAQATMDYILWLDADDILTAEDAERFKSLKEQMAADLDVVMMRYNTGFDAQGKVVFSYYRERLSRRSGDFRWREPVHEYLEAGGKRLMSDVCITHAKPHTRVSGRNIRIYENLLKKGETLTPRGMYYYARELKDHGRYGEAIKQFRMFLDSGLGWVEDNIAACGDMARCYIMENRPDDAVSAMLQSFRYDEPRAETCCQLGYFFKEQSRFKQAAFWFELALTLKPDTASWGFRHEDSAGYVPCIELAVCCDKMGDYERAAAFNERAGTYKPDSPAVQYNRKYFAGKITKSR